jgi:flagellar biosynthesis protein FlhG
MKDQAQKLREMVHALKKKNDYQKNETVLHHNIEDKEGARVIAITSGKGGVGKTNLTINLGIALSKLGYRVTILDADLGLANIDVVIGLIPKFTLADVIRGEKTLQEIIIEGPYRIQLISGGSGLKELVNLTEEQLLNLIKNLKYIGEVSDFILIDTGAGINYSVLSFVNATEEVILVTTPEPTSITDAYAMIKNIVYHDREKVIRVLVNRVEDAKEGLEVFNKLDNVSRKFLNRSLQRLGYLYDDTLVSKSVKLQKPFLLSYPNSLVSQEINRIAFQLVGKSDIENYEVSGFRRFMNRFMHHCKKPFHY